MNTAQIRAFGPEDIDAAIGLWRRTPGMGLNSTDEPVALAAFLARNPGLSHVATVAQRVIGTLLAGHDGRRGFLYHLAVDGAYRRQGIGRQLVQHALTELAASGISRTSIHVFADNDEGKAFWLSLGWTDRADLSVLQHIHPAL